MKTAAKRGFASMAGVHPFIGSHFTDEEIAAPYEQLSTVQE